MMGSARWSDDIGPDDWIDVEKPREYLEALEKVARAARQCMRRLSITHLLT